MGGRNAPAWPERAGHLALCAHLLDQDDLHRGSGSHPGGVVWSAVCATAGEASAGDAFAAAAFGYELTVRLAEALAPERARWHSTAVAGVAGAAGAAALLVGSDAADAVAHAVSVAGGSTWAVVERTGTRFVHRAHAAASGVACARAAATMAGSRGGLESGRGAFAAIDGDAVLARRDSTCLEETAFRILPGTGFAHAAIEAARALGPLEPDEIAHVTATVSPPVAVAVASNPAPANDEERWWSIEHAIAAALGSAALAARVRLVDGGDGWGARVEATLGDGTVRSAEVEGPRPASDDDLRAKWQRLTGTDGSALFERLAAADDEEPFGALLLRLP